MKQKKILCGMVVVALVLSSCASHYAMDNISRTRIVVDNRYDRNPDVEAVRWLKPYKQHVDSVMSPVVGRVAHYMAKARPESGLSNLLSDILLWGGQRFNEHPAFAVYNIGGIRAALVQGDVTFGDVVDVAPFENKICFLTLSGRKVLELFGQIAHRGGEGVSHGVELEITADGQLRSAKIGGAPIDPEKQYRVVTLDYVAQGNDQMTAFKSGTQVLSPQSEENNVRYLITDYLRDCMKRGVVIDNKVEGRIKIVK